MAEKKGCNKTVSIEENGLEQVDIEKIHQRFLNRKLDYLVGAGASIDAGLPTWSDLNDEIVRRFFASRYKDEVEARPHVVIEPEPDELDALAEIFIQRFRREPVIDLVRSSLENEGQFFEILKTSLYGPSAPPELKPLQFELAAALNAHNSGPKRLFTTNFDDLLERASGRLSNWNNGGASGFDGDVIATNHGWKKRNERNAEIIHIHGYLPYKGQREGRIVLSESDFFETDHKWPTDALKTLMGGNGERSLLVVGMSLTDPRLRKLLHDRKSEELGGGDIYALLAKSSPPEDATLASRRAHKLLEHYEVEYWKERRVQVSLVENLEMLPLLLRKIRLGGNPRDWCKKAVVELQASVNQDLPEIFYQEEVQRIARLVLNRQIEFVRRRFEAMPEEELAMSFYVPGAEPPALQLAFHHNDRFLESRFECKGLNGASFQGVTQKVGEESRVEIEGEEDTESLAVYAFVTGTTVQVMDGKAGGNSSNLVIDVAAQSEQRTISSALAVPIYGTDKWLPLGVGLLFSNRRNPFWAGLSEKDSLDLHIVIRTTFDRLLKTTMGK